MAFTGFPAEAIHFYEGLAADNSRTYWLANKSVYEQSVRGPMLALLDELAAYGPFHVFRPNRDVRFAKDKTPYKDHVAAYGESQGGAGFYVQYSSTGMVAGSGYYHMAPDQLDRFRGALDSDKVGGEIATITHRLRNEGLEFSAISALKTAPRGYAKDHPRLDLLRMKDIHGGLLMPPDAIATRKLLDRITKTMTDLKPFTAWLTRHTA
jgi:uncharacterized protein (TIGR02453 family)